MHNIIILHFVIQIFQRKHAVLIIVRSEIDVLRLVRQEQGSPNYGSRVKSGLPVSSNPARDS